MARTGQTWSWLRKLAAWFSGVVAETNSGTISSPVEVARVMRPSFRWEGRRIPTQDGPDKAS